MTQILVTLSTSMGSLHSLLLFGPVRIHMCESIHVKFLDSSVVMEVKVKWCPKKNKKKGVRYKHKRKKVSTSGRSS